MQQTNLIQQRISQISDKWLVARVRSGKSLKGETNYNEHKVREGKAELIMANGYSKEIDQLKFNDKLNRLQKLADLNTRTSTH